VPDVKEILEAVERGDVDRLLRLCSLTEIADAWWRYMVRCDVADKAGAAAPTWDADPDGWASEIWQEEILNQREEAVRELLRLMAERAPAGADLGYLGAGPIEDFATNDESRLRWIESEAARSPNFQAALANVWQKMKLSDESNARIRRAAESDKSR
jgi:hypothetical protein